jgi:hypothetical protein
LIVALEAYIDDSGNGNPPVYILAGFVARAEKWTEFTEEWRLALAKPPGLTYFKMKEAAALRGQFYGWSREDRDQRLGEMISLIRRHVISGVSTGVYHADYNSIIKEKIAKQTDSPYFIMYHGMIAATLRFLEKNKIAEKIDFIFDEQFGQSDQVQTTYSAMVEFAPPRVKHLLGSRPIHRSELECLPLQAADLLAWHIRRWFDEHEKGREFDGFAMKALKDIPQFEDGWTMKRLSNYLSRAYEINRETGRVFPYQVRPCRPSGEEPS